MSRNNDVFQVLVTSGDAAVLAADNGLGDLATGQIGVFDFDTNQSIDATTSPRAFYLATGLANGDVAKSSGSHVQKRNIQYYNQQAYVAPVPGTSILKDYTGQCGTEYGVRLELRNAEIYQTQGYVQYTKFFSVSTACCVNGVAATSDSNEITKRLKVEINSDSSGMLTAIAVARDTLTKLDIDAVTTGVFSGDIAIGDEVSDADLIVLEEFNSLSAEVDWLSTDLVISTVTEAIHSYCAINLQYFYPRQTVAILSKVVGFDCNGTVAVLTPTVYEQGSGYDVKQLEYVAKGWKESPYRLSTLNGVADERTFNSVVTTNYTQIGLSYDQFSVGAWLEYLNNLSTIIAVPTGDTITLAALLLVLDAQTASGGFTALT